MTKDEALKTLQRYEPELYDEDRVRMEMDYDGDWVKYKDVLAALAQPEPASSPAPDVSLTNGGDIAELEHENRLLRARNERLEAERATVVPRLEAACGKGAMPPTMMRKHLEQCADPAYLAMWLQGAHA